MRYKLVSINLEQDQQVYCLKFIPLITGSFEQCLNLALAWRLIGRGNRYITVPDHKWIEFITADCVGKGKLSDPVAVDPTFKAWLKAKGYKTSCQE